MSIDGYIALPNGETDWMLWNWGSEWNWDEKLRKYHTELTETIDCILLSRQMAQEGFIAHWAKVTENRNDPQFVFAKHIADTKKVVFTKTLDQTFPIPGGWDNTSIANGDIESEISQLKKQEGKDIIVYGGAAFVSSLIKAGLIDEFHLLINPVEVGNGMTIFKELDGKLNLALVKATFFACGIAVLKYVQKRN